MTDGAKDKTEGGSEPTDDASKPESHESDVPKDGITRHGVPADDPPGHAVPEHDIAKVAGPVRPQSEWTVSDRRGPLDSAEKLGEGDIERFGPAHEADAEAAEDRPTSPHRRDDSLSDPMPAPPPSEHSSVGEEVRPADRSTLVEPSPRRTSAWPIVAGLVGGAIIGAAVAALIFNAHKPGQGSDQKIAALSSRVAAMEKRPDPRQPLSSLRSSVSDLYNKLAALQKAAAPSPAKGGGAAADNGAAQQKIADLGTRLDGLLSQTKDLRKQAADLQKEAAASKGLADKVTSLETAVSGAQKQASTVQSNLEAVQAQQKSLEGKVGVPALAVVTDSLVQQVDHGEPFPTHVDALTSLGADPAKVAVLRQYADKGVPSAKTLAAKFAPLAEPMAAVGHLAPPNAGLLDRLKSGMSGLVTVRRSDSAAGNDLPSHIARIESALSHDDVTEAYETWNLLPAEAKAKSEAWGALAKTSAVARAAARSLEREAIVSLGVKKS